MPVLVTSAVAVAFVFYVYVLLDWFLLKVMTAEHGLGLGLGLGLSLGLGLGLVQVLFVALLEIKRATCICFSNWLNFCALISSGRCVGGWSRLGRRVFFILIVRTHLSDVVVRP